MRDPNSASRRSKSTLYPVLLAAWPWRFLLIGSALGALLLPGCKPAGPTSGDSQPARPKPVFHLITHGVLSDIFWANVAKGWNDACALYGVDGRFVTVRVEDNVAEVLGNLQTVVSQGTNPLACVISDPKMLETPLRQAIQKGTPVVAVNIRDPRPAAERIPYLIYVGEDSTETGRANMKAVIERFRAKAGRAPRHSIYLVHAVGVQSLEERGVGMKEVCDRAGTKFTKVACKFDPTTTQEAVRAFLSKNPDVESVHSSCSQVAHWAMEMLRQMGRLGTAKEPFAEGKVYVGGIDMDEILLRDILKGDVVITIDQQPYLQGYMAVVLLYTYYNYHMLPANDILTGPAVVDASNAAQRLAQQQRISGVQR
jgi:simple sugar transport system substrate-binding protein